MSLDRIRIFAISKLGWIKKQQAKLRSQERETPREYVDRESHYVWGKRYLLTVIEADAAPGVELEHNRMILRVRPGTHRHMRQAIVNEWYRGQIKGSAAPIISKWESLLNVKVARCFVRQMKTRWGSCNPRARNIRLNSDLAKKPKVCLEYVVLHEILHLIERTHNSRFIDLLDRFMPRWQFYRDDLNKLPVRHEDWVY
jgi:hypothetical protein